MPRQYPPEFRRHALRLLDEALPGGDVNAVRPHVDVLRRDLVTADGVLDGDLSVIAIDHAGGGTFSP